MTNSRSTKIVTVTMKHRVPTLPSCCDTWCTQSQWIISHFHARVKFNIFCNRRRRRLLFIESSPVTMAHRTLNWSRCLGQCTPMRARKHCDNHEFIKFHYETYTIVLVTHSCSGWGKFQNSSTISAKVSSHIYVRYTSAEVQCWRYRPAVQHNIFKQANFGRNICW